MPSIGYHFVKYQDISYIPNKQLLPQVEKFYSKNYLDKEEGLARLRAELTSPSNGSTKTSPNKTARAAALLLQRSLRDKVFSVYSQANEVLKTLFLEFVPGR